MRTDKLLKSIVIWFIVWIVGGVILDLLQFGVLSGVIAFGVGVWLAIKEYNEEV